MPWRFAPMFAKYEERIRELEEQLETSNQEVERLRGEMGKVVQNLRKEG